MLGSVILPIIGVLGFIALIIGMMGSMTQYLKIKALKQNRKYSNFSNEFLVLSANWFQQKDIIDAAPVSYLFKMLDDQMYAGLPEEIGALFRKKYKFELMFWLVFAAMILSIPLVELVLKPMNLL